MLRDDPALGQIRPFLLHNTSNQIKIVNASIEQIPPIRSTYDGLVCRTGDITYLTDQPRPGQVRENRSRLTSTKADNVEGGTFASLPAMVDQYIFTRDRSPDLDDAASGVSRWYDGPRMAGISTPFLRKPPGGIMQRSTYKVDSTLRGRKKAPTQVKRADPLLLARQTSSRRSTRWPDYDPFLISSASTVVASLQCNG